MDGRRSEVAPAAPVPAGVDKSEQTISDTQYSILLITPAMLLIGFFALFPLFFALNVALRQADLTYGGIRGFVGLDNFRFALNDRFFWHAARVTIIFTVVAVSAEMVLGISIAFLLHGARWLKGILRALLLLPLATAPAATGLIWRYMYHPDFGVFNYLMSVLHLPEQNWLGNVNLALPSVIVFDIWQWTPFVAVITLAGLQALPREPFEAAEIDGGSLFQVVRRLTFPMLAPVLSLVFVLRTIDALRLYDAVYSLTSGGPGTATETLTYYLYRLGLKFFRMDYASAISFLFLYVCIVFTIVALRWLSQEQAKRTVLR